MIYKRGIVRILAVVITVLILAVAPLFAKNPLSEKIWSNKGPGQHKWSHILSPPADGDSPPPSHDWNGRKKKQDDSPTYKHPGVPLGKFPIPEIRNRYGSVEAWRNEDEVMPLDADLVPIRDPRERPIAKPKGSFKHKAEWLEQQIVADYPDHPLVDETFVMLKTGGQTQWSRMPWHLYSTLTRVKHFALYSDLQGSIGGYEIIDILKDLPEDVLKEKEFKRYKFGHQMEQEHWAWNPAELNTDGGWTLDKYKNLPMLHHAYKTKPDAKWYFFMDDDTWVFWDNLYYLLDQYNSTEPVYLGSPASTQPPNPFAHGGSGVAISQGAMALLFDQRESVIKKMLDDYARFAVGVCCGDYVVAVALGDRGCHLDKLGFDEYAQYGGPFHGGSIWGYMFKPGLFSIRPISLHHIDSFQAERLYEYEKARSSSGSFTNAELYRDFVLPYISTERKNWRMPRSDKSYKAKKGGKNPDSSHHDNAEMWDDGKPIFPWKTREHCRKACELNELCQQWSHTEGQGGTCELALKAFTLGRAENPYHSGLRKQDQHAWYTGWMINRIRHKRSLDAADPLAYDGETQTWNDNNDTSEGWYLRKIKDEQYKPYDKDVTTF